jgi:hypothetical protein
VPSAKVHAHERRRRRSARVRHTDYKGPRNGRPHQLAHGAHLLRGHDGAETLQAGASLLIVRRVDVKAQGA